MYRFFLKRYCTKCKLGSRGELNGCEHNIKRKSSVLSVTGAVGQNQRLRTDTATKQMKKKTSKILNEQNKYYNANNANNKKFSVLSVTNTRGIHE